MDLIKRMTQIDFANWARVILQHDFDTAKRRETEQHRLDPFGNVYGDDEEDLYCYNQDYYGGQVFPGSDYNAVFPN